MGVNQKKKAADPSGSAAHLCICIGRHLGRRWAEERASDDELEILAKLMAGNFFSRLTAARWDDIGFVWVIEEVLSLAADPGQGFCWDGVLEDLLGGLDSELPTYAAEAASTVIGFCRTAFDYWQESRATPAA